MSKQYDPEDPAEMHKWTRAYLKIKSDEATDVYLIRTGVTADTPKGWVKRMNITLAWLWPQLTPRTQPLYDEIRTIVEDYHQKKSHVPVRASQTAKPGGGDPGCAGCIQASTECTGLQAAQAQ